MKLKGSLSCLQELATGFYPLTPSSYIFKIPFNIIPSFMVSIPKWPVPSDILTKILYTVLMRLVYATYCARLYLLT